MATDSIAFRIVNHSADLHSSSVLVYQKNVVTTFDELAVGWQVRDSLGAGWVHPFWYDLHLADRASESWGNFAPPMDHSFRRTVSRYSNAKGKHR